MEPASEFKKAFLTALRANEPDAALLELVREWQARFPSMRDLYDILQQIWLEFGFDERSDGGSLQDRLEFVMEKVWYDCPVS